MNQGGWYSKKGVMKDLARATGIKHFDENAFVVGERPPPVLIDSEVDASEMLYRCGGVLPDGDPNEILKPDLNGITEMLRMVDTYNDIIEVPKPTPTDTENQNTTDNVLTISKLNPNVKEFLPSQTNASSDKENNSSKSNKNVKDDSCNGEKDDLICKDTKNEPCSLNIDIKLVNSAVQVNGDSKNEQSRKEIKEKLKTKISSTSNATSIKVKHERNLAIMSLLKLHSKPTTEVNGKPNRLLINSQKHKTELPTDEPLKLMPPNYYETSNAQKESNDKDKCTNTSENVTNNLQNNACNVIIDQSLVGNVTEPINTKIMMDGVGKISNIKPENIPSMDNVHKELDLPDDIVNSVDKVTKWLESNSIVNTSPTGKTLEDVSSSPESTHNLSPSSSKVTNETPKKEIQKVKTQNPSLYLGPITFKRKVPVSNSPTLSSSDQATRKAPSSTYIPSAYASELSKTYMERANTKREIGEDIWTKVSEELKRKDAILKKKAEEENQLTTSNEQEEGMSNENSIS